MKKNKALILKLLPLLLFVASEEIYAKRRKGHETPKPKQSTQSTGNTGKSHKHSGTLYTVSSDDSTSSQNRLPRDGNLTSKKGNSKDDQSSYTYQPAGKPKPKRKNRQSSGYEDISYDEHSGRK